MTVHPTKKSLRWAPAIAVPVLIVAGVASAPLVTQTLSASASGDLPERSAAEVIALVRSSDVTAFSGTIRQSADLGLPELDGLGGGIAPQPADTVAPSPTDAPSPTVAPSPTDAPSPLPQPERTAPGTTVPIPGEQRIPRDPVTPDDTGAESSAPERTTPTAAPTTVTDTALDPSLLLEFLSGSRDARVFADGPERLRVQVLDDLAERDVVRNGSTAWLYDSEQASAVAVTLPEHDDAHDGGATALPDALATPATPAEVTERILDALDPSTAVSVASNVSVAGRAAYELVLTPRSDDTLVGSIALAVDGETGVPLRVSVVARGATDAALSLGFTKVSFDTPDPALFEFTPPAGTTITEVDLTKEGERMRPVAPGDDAADPGDGSGDELTPYTEAAVIAGEGWGSVVELPTASDGPGDTFEGLLASPLAQTLLSETDEGRALETTLFSALVTPDGRVLVGAVSVDTLAAAAALPIVSPAAGISAGTPTGSAPGAGSSDDSASR